MDKEKKGEGKSSGGGKSFLLIAIIVVSIIIAGGSLNLNTSWLKDSAKEAVGQTYKLVDQKTGQTIDLIVDTGGELVTFYTSQTGRVTLEKIESASGAKFSNKDGSLVLWNKNGEVILIRMEEPIFTGVINGVVTNAQAQ